MLKRILKKIVKNLAKQYGIIGRQECEFYCSAEAYAIVEGNTRICRSCFGRLGNLFKKQDVKVLA
jgi:hypothetical protein